MLATIGSYYGAIAAGAGLAFIGVLGFVSIEDGWRRRREGRARGR